MKVTVIRTTQGAPVYVAGVPGTFEYGVVYEVDSELAKTLKATGQFEEVVTEGPKVTAPVEKKVEKVVPMELPRFPEETVELPEEARTQTGEVVRVRKERR